MITRILFTLVFGLAVTDAVADTSTADPEEWYVKGYAPHWNEAPWESLEQISAYYDQKILSHDASGKIESVTSQEWLDVAIKGWQADAWTGSELVGIQTDRLNESTVAFKSRWLDHYKDREDEYSCGWYLADLRDGSWVFTNYADIDCTDHGM